MGNLVAHGPAEAAAHAEAAAPLEAVAPVLVWSNYNLYHMFILSLYYLKFQNYY